MTNFLPVAIDMQQICQHLSDSAGRPVTDVEATVWLRANGFVRFGDQWLADEQSKQKLDGILQQLALQPAH